MTTLNKWPDDIHVIGAGGIGTHVILALIELGAKRIHVWDDDVVSPHNLPTQFIYNKGDIHEPKVNGVRRFVEMQEYDVELFTHPVRVNSRTILSGIVISGVDSMKSRQDIWDSLKVFGGQVPHYIDGRIGGDEVYVLTVDPCNPYEMKLYEKTLYLDEVASDLSCATRENPHSALAVAQTVSVNLSLLLAGEPVKNAVRRNLSQEARGSVQQPLFASQ